MSRVVGFYPEPVTELTVHLRSFTDQLLYLTQGVDIPESDKKVALPAAMQKLDFIRVQQSDARPDHAYVAVPYRGRWCRTLSDPAHRWRVWRLTTATR